MRQWDKMAPAGQASDLTTVGTVTAANMHPKVLADGEKLAFRGHSASLGHQARDRGDGRRTRNKPSYAGTST